MCKHCCYSQVIRCRALQTSSISAGIPANRGAVELGADVGARGCVSWGASDLVAVHFWLLTQKQRQSQNYRLIQENPPMISLAHSVDSQLLLHSLLAGLTAFGLSLSCHHAVLSSLLQTLCSLGLMNSLGQVLLKGVNLIWEQKTGKTPVNARNNAKTDEPHKQHTYRILPGSVKRGFSLPTVAKCFLTWDCLIAEVILLYCLTI